MWHSCSTIGKHPQQSQAKPVFVHLSPKQTACVPPKPPDRIVREEHHDSQCPIQHDRASVLPQNRVPLSLWNAGWLHPCRALIADLSGVRRQSRGRSAPGKSSGGRNTVWGNLCAVCVRFGCPFRRGVLGAGCRHNQAQKRRTKGIFKASV